MESIMIAITRISLFALLSCFYAPGEAVCSEVAVSVANRASQGNDSLVRDLTRRIAVLYFENHSSATYDRFVRGLSDMLMTSLGQAQRLTVIERVQIDKAMENFRLELSGPIDTKTAVEVGEWLGADAVVLGSFTQFGKAYRIDARLIDAGTGELVVAQNVQGAERDVIAMVDQLGAQLSDSVGEKEAEFVDGTGIFNRSMQHSPH